MKYADNLANVQKYSAGQTVPMVFDIRAPHTGYANVSIIDITVPDGKILAANLKKWDVYASTATSIPSSEENFSIKIPTNLPSKCSKAGQCAIQMHWNAPSIDQTYQSCIDFTLKGASKRHVRDFSAPEGDEVLGEEI